MTDRRLLCLTLDLENDWYIDDPQLDHLTLDHLEDFIKLMGRVDVPLSVFVVGETLERYPEAVERLGNALDCEFHLHSYGHHVPPEPDFETDLERGMAVFEDHFGDSPTGYRAPKGAITEKELRTLDEYGFVFDSSVFPSYRPGVYNNLRAPLVPYRPDRTNLVEVPLGVFRGVRVPTAHSYLKAGGRPLCWSLKVAPLSPVLVYNVHLQDLYRTDSHEALPRAKRWFMKRNLDRSEALLEQNLVQLQSRGYHPVHISEVANVN